MKKVLIVDSHDSFVYNIVHILRELGAGVEVMYSDEIAMEAVLGYDKILLSPGPGLPRDGEVLLPLIRRYAPTHSILGVCLGEQAIGEAFGARLLQLDKVFHGVESRVRVTAEDPLFEGLGVSFQVGRYHSWVVDREGFPPDLEITAVEEEMGPVMALRHRRYDVRGVQFHPESILCPQGKRMLQNWMNL